MESDFLNDTWKDGLLAGVATTAVVSALGRAEGMPAVAPLNAISHIAWGEKAANQNEPSLKYTATGIALNMAAVGSRAGVQRSLFPPGDEQVEPWRPLLQGMAVSALAYVTDYYLVPKRFTPGFEKRLSPTSMAVVYGVLGLSLAARGCLRAINQEKGT